MKKKPAPKKLYRLAPPLPSAVVREEPPSTVHEVGAFEAKTHLSALLDRVARGEAFVITKRGKPIAELKPAAAASQKRELGWARGKIWMAPDFDAPLDDFKEYME